MCLAIPGKVVEVLEKGFLLEYPGVKREVEMSLVDLEVGDYCIVSGGVVVAKVEEEKAVKFLEMVDG